MKMNKWKASSKLINSKKIICSVESFMFTILFTSQLNQIFPFFTNIKVLWKQRLVNEQVWNADHMWSHMITHSPSIEGRRLGLVQDLSRGLGIRVKFGINKGVLGEPGTLAREVWPGPRREGSSQKHSYWDHAREWAACNSLANRSCLAPFK